MTGDLPPIGRHRRPGSAPRADVLDAVVREGRRRLRRAAVLSGGAAVALVGILFGATMIDGPGNEALILPPASPGALTTASPVLTPAPVAPTAAPLSSPGSVLPTSAPALTSPPAVRPTAPVSAGAPAPSSWPVTPYRENPEVNSGAATCPVDNVLTGSGTPGVDLCLMVGKGPSSVKTGGTYTAELDLCNMLSSSSVATVSFRGGREHDLAFGRDRVADWTWSRHHTFPQGAHTRKIERGECLAWTTTWNTRDDSGVLMPPGTYDIVSSAEVNGRTESIAYTVEVTP